MTSTSSGSGRSRSRQRPDRTPPPPGTDRADGFPADEFDVEYQPGQRRGAHRTATPAVIEQLPFLVVALVVVVAIVVVVGLLTGGDDPGAAAPAGGDPAATGEATSPPAGTEPPATEPPATTEPVTSSPAPTADRSVPLVVLNGTSTSGLAGAVGTELEELGWIVETVGNAPDQPVEATTVLYSDPAQQVTAEAVAADLDAVAEQDDSADGQVVVVVGTDRA